uniref:thiamine transporter 2-like isoform X2 n=1 Tax=Doryrhamphus excisus TaxID=161450 RepID=UPI0025ADB58E|nr:thiamine transporter 2-like isoform X2 [Doryrhamphus excisus]
MGCWANLKSSNWAYPTAVLSLYGFFAYCKIAEPFLTPYLIGPHKNISEEVVTNYLFPIWTYSYLAFLFPVFLLTDYLRHKPIIVMQGLFLVINYVLLCFAQGVPAMIFLEVSNAIVTSSDVAFFSYIYSVIPSENYQRATSYIRSSILFGYTFGGSLGQVLISLAGVAIVAFLISFWLPYPQRSMFFNWRRVGPFGQKSQDNADETVLEEEDADFGKQKINDSTDWRNGQNVVNAGLLLWQSFRESYSSRHLIYWSLWWALATAGYTQIFNYIQLMWNHIEPSKTSSVYNGGVEAACSLAGATAAFLVGHIKVSWTVWGELALGLFSAIGAGSIFVIAFTSNIWACYAGYALFKSCYMFLITVTTFQIAANLSMECYALMFGINTFVALFLQTMMTIVFVDEATLGLDIVTQFIIYGIYYAVISVLFLIRGTYTACTIHCSP